MYLRLALVRVPVVESVVGGVNLKVVLNERYLNARDAHVRGLPEQTSVSDDCSHELTRGGHGSYLDNLSSWASHELDGVSATHSPK
jgi:hypothetical protein